MSNKKQKTPKKLPPHMKIGRGKFKFSNNDYYEGEFLADSHNNIK